MKNTLRSIAATAVLLAGVSLSYAASHGGNKMVGGAEMFPDKNIVENAVNALGKKRVVFSSDLPVRLLGQCLGKTLGTDLPEETKKDILWNNAARLLPQWAGVKPF